MDRQEGIMQLIYNKINDMIGAGNQLFCMQFPAQPLNYRQYQYDTSDRNSVLAKPYSVQEAEFRLSDQLFDVSPITAASNGEKLSIVYHTLVNNYIPQLNHLAPFIKDRAGLGRFLLDDSGEKDEKGKPLSRIELSKNLYKIYLEEKNKWEEEKSAKFKSFKDRNDLDGYAKWQSSYGMVRQEQLNNLYNDAVVRGHLHEVLTLLGYLNASSIAEELELGKQKMRNSARSSLDESMTVYPVQFQPNNWFKALSPNLDPQDLTMAQESIRDQYIVKQRELSRAKAELKQMELLSFDPNEITKIENDIATQKKNLNKAESELITKYGDSVVGFAKVYFKATGATTVIDLVTAQNLGALDISKTYIDALTGAVQGIAATNEQQQKLNDAISNLTELKSRKAQLESRDWKFNKASLEHRIEELQTEVNYIADLIAEVHKAKNNSPKRIFVEKKAFDSGTITAEIAFSEQITGGTFTLEIGSTKIDSLPGKVDTKSANDFQTQVAAKFKDSTVTAENSKFVLKIPSQTDLDILLVQDDLEPKLSEPKTLSTPQTETDAEINGMFTDILIKITDSTDNSQTSLDSSANSSRWNVSGWFTSAGGQSSSSSGKSAQETEFFKQEMEIGFRVAKVSFDRGGWFNPQIFKMSHAFSRLADMLVSPGLSVADIPGKNQQQLKELTEYTGADGKKQKYILPAFPVAMVIAKDITIKVKIDANNSKSAKSVVENASANGSGFLCFSASSSSSSKSSSESTFHGSHGGFYYIRIPGPQVIGYFLQFVPQDNSLKYEPTYTDQGESPVIEAFKLYNQAKEIMHMQSAQVKLSQAKE